MDRIANVDGQAVVSGQHPGLPSQQIPLWERGSNVLFEDLAVKPAPGQSTLFVPLDATRVTGMLSLYILTGGVIVPGLVWGSGTKLYKGTTVPTTVNVSRLVGGAYTGGPNDLWSFVQFGQAVLATNGKDEVQYLAPLAANFVNISTVSDLASSFRCRSLIVKGAYVLAFNTNNDPTEVRWCTEDNPLVWTPAAANSARDLQLRDLLSQIAAVSDFADGVLVAGTVQAHFVRFVGAPLFFSQEHLIEGASSVSKAAVIAFDRVAYGFGPDGIWETDGASVEQISTPSIHKYVYEDTYDPLRKEQTVCWADPDNIQIFWSYPHKNGLGTTVSFDRRQRVWSLHDYWRTAATQGGPWLFPVVGGLTGGIFGQGGGQGAVVGEPKPVGIQDRIVITTGYNEPAYDGLSYGGITVVET